MFSAGFRNEFSSALHPLHVVFIYKLEEFYVCIYATREGDYVLFHHEGGVDVGDVDAKAQKLLVGVDERLNPEDIKKHLLVHAPEDKKELSDGDGREMALGVGRLMGSGHRPERACLAGWEQVVGIALV